MISYSGLRTAPKVTLPSVEMWSTNMNIVRDPPRSIMTRRKERVGDTQRITLEQDDSQSRISENILVYARGTNPMVTVSYNNASGQQQASLPYKIQNVRPPVLTGYDLLPLSRLPRLPIHNVQSKTSRLGRVQLTQCPESKRCVQTPLSMNRTRMRSFVSGRKETVTETSRARTMKPLPTRSGFIPSRLQKNATQKLPFSHTSFNPRMATRQRTSVNVPKTHAFNEPYVKERTDIQNRPRKLIVSSIHQTTRKFDDTLHTNRPHVLQPQVVAKEVYAQKNYRRRDELLSTYERTPVLQRHVNRTEVTTHHSAGGSQEKTIHPEHIVTHGPPTLHARNVVAQKTGREQPDAHVSTHVSLEPRRSRGGYSNPSSGRFHPERVETHDARLRPVVNDRRHDQRVQMHDYFRV
jgi:hypothetical protein